MNAGAMGIEPATIAKLGKGERGCKVTLFGKQHMFDWSSACGPAARPSL
jgi:hypothetical protein